MSFYFINPLTNPIFSQVMSRFLIAFIVGFFLILILNKLKLKGIFKTNIGKRYSSWFIIGIIYLAAIFFGNLTSRLLLLIVIILAIYEVGKLSKLPKQYIYSLYILALISVYVVSFYPQNFYTLILLYFLVFSVVSLRENNAKQGLFNLSFSIFVSIWIIFALSHFTLLSNLNNSLDSTRSILLLIGFAVPLSDIGAYVIGKSFSKTRFDKFKIAPNISPNKTYAGAIGNILGAGIGIAIMYFAMKSYMNIFQMIVLAIIIGVFGVVGDLTESLFKRYFKKKDSGSLIPGHGGILDRIDSAMRVIIGVYYFMLFIL